ncbi:hypothetical protein UFOVP1470_49 [uncultured Caudovirales phage]|uniref:Uncharacterized protein n=1 Tax=uncultured Caudovirales phage TaxID=2100421 RepID=A0A6J5S4T9_9CAUD|nr:hypothetical protein UFOVP939_29 [uncultured Caudovirales phage]CAB4178591.1 hypothetical protein UFOVP1018_47 [uncultured Caudovirales phage]CAB4184294.1 hypothetical protein UFOVP1105_48 [uncultured Caudovirales phage]CAB4202807.1 hypothetical protein UFOVP1372_38 [uncultured Caudovirales phage]CAB4215058.1 hypothetical protein UFOVP1470_49 [uncultured Caudovirales phage]
MLTISEIRERLKDRRPNIVGDVTGLSYGTIAGIRNGVNQNPTLKVMQSLSDYFEGIKNDQPT